MENAGTTIDRSNPNGVLEVLVAFLKLGLTSFGGPIAHLGYFREEFVIRRKWLNDSAYADVVALCQFLPGPCFQSGWVCPRYFQRRTQRPNRRNHQCHCALPAGPVAGIWNIAILGRITPSPDRPGSHEGRECRRGGHSGRRLLQPRLEQRRRNTN
jgi:Chromate transporter